MQEIHNDWYELTAGTPFIMDLGFEPVAQVPTDDGGTKKMARFAAFVPVPNMKKHQIVEVSTDLGALRQKYSIRDDMIFRVGRSARPQGSESRFNTAAR